MAPQTTVDVEAMKVQSEIKPDSRVKIAGTNKYGQDVSYYATVIEWTKLGLLKVELDLMSASGRQTKCVSATCARLFR